MAFWQRELSPLELILYHEMAQEECGMSLPSVMWHGVFQRLLGATAAKRDAQEFELTARREWSTRNAITTASPQNGRRRYWVGLFAIAFFGILVRGWRITEVPYGIWHDEAQNTIETRRILHEPHHWPTFIADRSQMPALPFYIFAPLRFPTGCWVSGQRRS